MSFPTFATLGTFVVDNYVYVQKDKSTRKDTQLGGGGFWACAGARIWLKPNAICMPVGGNSLTDLPGQLAGQLEKLDAQDEISMWVWREERTGGSILQSEIKYDGHERSFRYLNPRDPLTLSCIPSTSRIHSARYLHFCCPPSNLSSSLEHLLTYPGRSLVVYEPIPSACSPDHYSALRDVLPNIDIFSPNHEELELFFDISERIPHHDFCQRIESYCETYHDLGAKTIIVRAGSHGSFISNRNEAFGKIGSEWLPPYWTPDEATQMVKNTTGAGNSFLGGLCAGLYLAGDDVFRAARYGSVSASFIIQQAGLPLLDISETGEEYWNGESAEERLDRYLRESGITSTFNEQTD